MNVEFLRNAWEWLSSRASAPMSRYLVATIVGAAAIALLLPGRSGQRIPRWVSAFLFAVASLMLVLTGAANYGISIVSVVVWIFSLIAVIGGLAMVSSRKPVYAALWFAMTLFAVGGLFFVAGAQFLGIATIAVYAGAIVVTFLFVLMLAQPEGHTFYDRMSWGTLPRWLAALAGMSVASLIAWSTTAMIPQTVAAVPATAEAEGVANASPPDGEGIGEPEHVAALGGRLFSKYLVEIQIAGALLLVALVGAVTMAAQRGSRRSLVAQLQRATGNGQKRGVIHRA